MSSLKPHSRKPGHSVEEHIKVKKRRRGEHGNGNIRIIENYGIMPPPAVEGLEVNSARINIQISRSAFENSSR